MSVVIGHGATGTDPVVPARQRPGGFVGLGASRPNAPVGTSELVWATTVWNPGSNPQSVWAAGVWEGMT